MMTQASGTYSASFGGVMRAVSGTMHLREGRACQIRHGRQYTGWWRGQVGALSLIWFYDRHHMNILYVYYCLDTILVSHGTSPKARLD
jgi:hypothetical protein